MYSQSDSINVFENNTWTTRVHGGWLNTDKVYLFPRNENDSYGGDYISLDKNNNIQYIYKPSCPTGEKWAQIKKISFENGEILIEHRLYANELSDEQQEDFKLIKYSIIEWNKKNIILKRNN